VDHKFYLEADIKVQEESTELRKAAASVINLPKDGEKQHDLLYFTALFVSSGANLNKAYFMPSELIKAENTIVNKALDVEHKEEEIIGHIYDRAFIDPAGNKLDIRELAAGNGDAINTQTMHVIIAGIVYKNRFPNLAEEIAKSEWKVSMECYFKDYEVKVGNLILSRQDAEAMGFAEETMFAKMARVIKNGAEIAKGNVERVLRGIAFSGCGIVKNPANPPSVIMETANNKDIKVDDKEVITLDYDKLKVDDNKLTSSNIENPPVTSDTDKEKSEMVYNDTVGICVSYKKRLFSHEPAGPDTEVIHENWCTLYDKDCASSSRDTTDPNCLKNQVEVEVVAVAKKLFSQRDKNDRREKLLSQLDKAIKNTKKLE
jgi:hypothetical protein